MNPGEHPIATILLWACAGWVGSPLRVVTCNVFTVRDAAKS